MARPKMDDGKRVPLSTRVSEATAAELDEARGSMSRSAALDAALSLWLANARTPARAPGRGQRVKAGPPPESVPPMTSLPPGPRSKPVPGQRRLCPHPGTRTLGGWCDPCGALVESGGYLPA